MIRAKALPSSHAPLLLDEHDRFRIVILHGDAAAGGHAKRVSDRLLQALEDEDELDRVYWSFDDFKQSEIRTEALKVAIPAQMLMVSSCGDRDLPPEIEVWIKMWVLSAPKRPRAMALVFNDPDGEFAAAIRDRLARAVAGTDVDVFPQMGGMATGLGTFAQGAPSDPLAAMRDWCARPAGGIHRTHLRDTGARAQKPRPGTNDRARIFGTSGGVAQ